MKYYFLGICGTAMASLAVLLKQKGHEVWGTDQNIYPPMSDFLKLNNIPVREGYDIANLRSSFDSVIIGNALSRGNPEVEEILNRRLPFASLPEMIRQEFAQSLKSVVITGTHGKTTTTALMSWILEEGGLSPTFLIGGISRNFEASARIGRGEHFVIEGDEYDTAFFDKRPKFLHYLPHYLIINNIEFDHADIYRNIDQIKDGFRKLIRTVSGNGLIIANGDDPNVQDILSPIYSRVQTFGKSPANDWSYEDIKFSGTGMDFMVLRKGRLWNEFHIPLFGEYQINNALAVIAAATDMGLSPDQIQQGLSSFKNVDRRLELWGELNGAPFYDDFAHHPTAIRETLQALRYKHPHKKLVVIFEPRTNSMVRNIFQYQLTDAFSLADTLWITPIHRHDRIPENERLSLPRLKADLEEKHVAVNLLPDCKSIYPGLVKLLTPEHAVVLMTNGSLGGEYRLLREKIRKG